VQKYLGIKTTPLKHTKGDPLIHMEENRKVVFQCLAKEQDIQTADRRTKAGVMKQLDLQRESSLEGLRGEEGTKGDDSEVQTSEQEQGFSSVVFQMKDGILKFL
jgi:hypothetical protein